MAFVIFSRKYELNYFSPWDTGNKTKFWNSFSLSCKRKIRSKTFKIAASPRRLQGFLNFEGFWVDFYWARNHRMGHVVSIISRGIALPLTHHTMTGNGRLAVWAFPSDSVCCITLHTSDQVTASIYFSSFHLTHHWIIMRDNFKRSSNMPLHKICPFQGYFHCTLKNLLLLSVRLIW